MSKLDAARLLIGLLVTDKPSQAPQAVRDFGRLKPGRPDPSRQFVVTVARRLPASHRFEVGLASLIEFFALEVVPWKAESDGRIAHRMTVMVSPSSLHAMIILPGSSQMYLDRSLRAKGAVSRGNQSRLLKKIAAAADARRDRYSSRIEIERRLMIEAVLDIAAAYATEPYLSQLEPCADYSACLVRAEPPQPLARAG